MGGTTEAEVMARMLEASGVPGSHIILEPRARNTLQNAWEVLPLLPSGCRQIWLVTSDFHMPRAAYLFEAVFASRGLALEVVQHLAESDYHRESVAGDVSAVNAQSLLQRLENEVRFIREEVVQ